MRGITPKEGGVDSPWSGVCVTDGAEVHVCQPKFYSEKLKEGFPDVRPGGRKRADLAMLQRGFWGADSQLRGGEDAGWNPSLEALPVPFPVRVRVSIRRGGQGAADDCT
jgi:hypothetical protein